ncbi:hypothetical protein [Methylomagnum sp.]
MPTHPPGDASPFTPRRPPAKYVALLGGLALVLAAPDLALFIVGQALHVVWYVLHFALGSLELAIEHGFRSAFQVSRHTAQMMTAWLGLFVFLALFVWLYRRFAPRLAGFLSNRRRAAEPEPEPEPEPETANSLSEP